MAIFGRKRRGDDSTVGGAPLAGKPPSKEELAVLSKNYNGGGGAPPVGKPRSREELAALFQSRGATAPSSANPVTTRSLSIKRRLSERQLHKIAARMQRVPSAATTMMSDEENSDESGPSVALERLQRENDALSSRCRKLEAQNIIAAAQQVDFLSVVLGLSACGLCYYGYATCVFWLVNYPRYTCWLWRAGLVLAPCVYNALRWGVLYRRFMVFGVFAVFLIRVKLCRWRVLKFVKGDQNLDLAALRGSGEGEGRATHHYGDTITEDDIWEASYEINARFLYSSILRLRGLWVKTAQYLASRADFVPVSYVRELGKLQDEAPETSWEDARRLLADAGILDEFASIDEEPLASASIGQVHRATIRGAEGERVVVKVQHPHAHTLLTDDFRSLNAMAWVVGILEPEYKFIGILLREWADEARHELDFTREASNLELAHESIEAMKATTSMVTTHSDEGVGIPFGVEIPRPVKRLCRSKRVMVMTFCEGKRIDDLEQIRKCNVPKEAVMNALAQASAHMMYVTDIFNGDPHPGNIFIRPGTEDGDAGFTLTLLDWGLAKRLPRSKREGFCKLTYAAATFDYGLMMDSFATLGLKLKRENVAEDLEGVRFLLRDMAPRQVARKRLKAKMKTDMERTKGKKRGERVPVDSDAYPGEFFFFVRTNELLQGLGSKLGVSMQYLDVLEPYALQGLKLLSNNPGRIAPDPLSRANVVDEGLNCKIGQCLERLHNSEAIAGAQVCVIQHGQTLAHCVAGNLGSLKSEVPVRSDSLFLGFSCTKAITTTLVLKMMEMKYLDLDEPICKRIWPKFAPTIHPPRELYDALNEEDTTIARKWNWLRSITLRHVLTHTSGLWFATPSNMTLEILASCEKCVQDFEYNRDKPENTMLPVSEPGTECAYHYLSFGWIVAGCVIGAYYERNGVCKTYEEIYHELCASSLSQEIWEAGFEPCGCDSLRDVALVDAQFDVTRSMQLRREAQAMGELMEKNKENVVESDSSSSMMKLLLQGIKGREWLLDPRIWNSSIAVRANVPAAGGRFSAKGLALFYHELGAGSILAPETLEMASKIYQTESSLQLLQGQTSIASSGGSSDKKTHFGLGYAIINIEDAKDDIAIGHAGVGGSIGFHHKASKTSVAIMFNKVGGNEDSAKEIINIISKHLDW